MSAEVWSYRTRGRWRFWLALSCAAVLHLAAMAFGRVTHAPESLAATSDSPIDVIVTTDEEQAPLPDLADEPIPTLPVPEEFPDEAMAHPPRPRRVQTAPIRPENNAGSRLAEVSSNRAPARVAAVFAPRPDYPYEARREHRIGSGVASLTISEVTGEVTNAEMVQSTGNVILDSSSLSAFRRWRFKPGTVRAVRIPITYNLNGVSY